MTVHPRDDDSPPMLERLCGAFYRLLLRWYPPDFRATHGAEAASVFAEACRNSREHAGLAAVARRLFSAVLTVPREGLAERRALRRNPRPSLVHIAGELLRDLRFAGRGLRRRPALSIAVVVTLALGLGANTAIFSVVDATILRPLPYRDASRVVYLQLASPGQSVRAPAAADVARWSGAVQSLDRIEARRLQSVLLTGDAGATRVRLLQVTPGFLSSVGARPVLGRFPTPADGRPGARRVVVVSERLWRTRYDSRADIVGTTMTVDGSDWLVVGVAPEVRFDIAGIRIGLYAPLASEGSAPGQPTLRAIGWLRPGVSLETARAEFAAVSAMIGADGRRWAGALATPSNLFWSSGEFRDPLLALLAAAVLLLAIAIGNVTNLLLSAGEARRAELAVRRAIGAGSARLARLVLLETLLLALAGCAVGIGIAWAAVRGFTRLNPGIQMQSRLEAVHIDGVVIGFAVLVACVTAALCGLVPAWRASRASITATLRESGVRTGSRLRRLPQTFMAIQVAMSAIMLVASGLVGRAFLEMRFADPGFEADRVLSVQLTLPEARYPSPDRQAAFFDALLDRASRLPGVTAASIGYGAMPPSDFMTMGQLVIDATGESRAESWVSTSFVRPGYFALMGIPIRAGRELTAADRYSREPSVTVPVVIGGAAARQLWPGRDAIQQRFRLETARGVSRYEVVGVVGDVRGLDLLVQDCVDCHWQLYLPLPADRRFTEVLVRVADGAPMPIVPLQNAIRALDPDVPTDEELETGASSVLGVILRPRFGAALFGGFGMLALTLVAVGLYAVVAHAVSQRTREMGIRLALGARPGQVRRLVLMQGLIPASVGLVAGVVLALLATRAMTAFLYGQPTIDPLVLVMVCLVLLLVSTGAMLVPSVRATRINPIQALRSE